MAQPLTRDPDLGAGQFFVLINIHVYDVYCFTIEIDALHFPSQGTTHPCGLDLSTDQ